MSAATQFPWSGQPVEKVLQTLFANAPVAIARCSRVGTITEMNPAMEQMLGTVPPSPSLGDLIDPADHAEIDQLLSQMMSGDRNSFQVEHAILGEGGSGIWVKWSAWHVTAPDSEDYSLLIAEDTTVNRRAEQRVRQAERLEVVGRMAGGIAHDFNNIVTGILLYCDLLLAETQSGTRLRNYAEEIRAAGVQATGVVRQLLGAARPQDSLPGLLSLNDTIEGMQSLLARLIGQNKTLHLNLDPNLGLVKMKPTQVQQVLLNLVLNARDAMPDGGQISVETSNCKVQIVTEGRLDQPKCRESAPVTFPCVVFVVSDNGTGMNAETKEHLFDAFFTTKALDEGTGLGLTTVYDIVTSNGGLIYVDTAPGCGTRMTVLLPLVEATGHSSKRAIQVQNDEGPQLQLEKELMP